MGGIGIKNLGFILIKLLWLNWKVLTVSLLNLQIHVWDPYLKVYAFIDEVGNWVLPQFFV